MKHSVLVVVATGVVALGAGVAIAGLPSGSGGDDLVITTGPPRTTIASPNDTSGDESSTTATTRPPPSSSVVARTTTTGVSTTTTSPVVLRDPAELVVATANASAVSGVATRTAEWIRQFGYDASPVDAVGSDTSAVYFESGFEPEAARLAQEIGWTIGDIAPMVDMPPLRAERTFELVVLIGVDKA